MQERVRGNSTDPFFLCTLPCIKKIPVTIILSFLFDVKVQYAIIDALRDSVVISIGGTIMLLEDIFRKSDFNAAVQSIALDSRMKLGMDMPVHQLGIVVPDVAAAAAELEGKCIKPFILLGGPAKRWTERGSEGAIRSRLAFGYHQGIELELLEPGAGSDFYRRSLDKKGRPVIQHLGFLVSDVDSWAEKIVSAGYNIYVRGRLGLGPLRIDFAYMDTEKDAGIILEFICHRLFGIWIKPPVRLQQLIGRIEIKTGKRCIEV